jgi:hypothetical protein
MTTILITPLNAGLLNYCEGYTDASLVDKVQQNFIWYFQLEKSVSWSGKYSSVYYIQVAIIAITYSLHGAESFLRSYLLYS